MRFASTMLMMSHGKTDNRDDDLRWLPWRTCERESLTLYLLHQDEELILICDSCDNGFWHTFCLNPPLNEVPQGNWYCPSCSASREKEMQKKRRKERRAAAKIEGETRKELERREVDDTTKVVDVTMKEVDVVRKDLVVANNS